jgi:hypothetical protein
LSVDNNVLTLALDVGDETEAAVLAITASIEMLATDGSF